MKRLFMVPCLLLLAAGWNAAPARAAEQSGEALDLRQGVPADVYLVVEAKHNPERDFQQEYYEEVWQTVQKTEIIERAMKIVTSRMGQQQLEQATSVLEELQEAIKPIDMEALADCDQMIYAQQMVMFGAPGAPAMPTSQHLALLRVTPDVASSTLQGVTNLFELAEKYTNGELAIATSEVGDVSLTTLALPAQVPFQPTIAQHGDVLMFASSKELLAESIEMMSSAGGTSKFDDPRLATALEQLPEPEDGLVFYDAQAQFDVMRKIGTSLSELGGGDPNIERVVKFIDLAMDELAVFDYEVTVEYTEDNLNRTASYGRMMPDTDDALLQKMLDSGEPFQEWERWVPAGSMSYSLGTGVNLHVLYERIMKVLKEDVPEAQFSLQQFEAVQQQLDLYLDKDLLQAFSGEYANVSVVTENDKRQSVLALRCHKPDRIRELLHRGVDALQQVEWVKAQQLKLVESEQLEGFENVSASIMPFLGLQPVIGFRDGWMYIGQSAAAVELVLDTKAGEGETIKETEAFQRLDIEIEGLVQSISYSNTAENIRAAADALRKAGFAFQMALGMAGADTQDESLEPVKEVLALLPDVAKIVEKFDFLEAKITVCQAGQDADTYTRRSVTVVRPLKEEGAEEVAEEAAAN